MNSKSTAFALVSIKSLPLRTMVKRLPYATPTVYKAVHQLEEEDLVAIENGTVMVAENFKAHKLSEIYIQSLAHGIDPEFLTRTSTLSVWKAIAEHHTVKDIVGQTKLPAVSVKRILSNFHENELVLYRKRKPIVAEHNKEHPLHRLLSEYMGSETKALELWYPGEIPYRDIAQTPDQIERMLYQQIDGGLLVREAGFNVMGDSKKLIILESMKDGLSYEGYFLKKILTTEGVEDLCILLVKRSLLDYELLLELAKEKDLVNIVGCYLDILRNIDERLVPSTAIELFHREKTRKRRAFLYQEKEFGKDGWEAPYEKQWNLDLYLELGGIEHGVRGL